MTETMVLVTEIMIAIFASVIYAGVFYAKERQKNKEEEVQWKKMAATLVVGGFAGAAIALTGGEVTQVAVEQRMAAYAGMVAVVENVIKILVRQYR